LAAVGGNGGTAGLDATIEVCRLRSAVDFSGASASFARTHVMSLMPAFGDIAVAELALLAVFAFATSIIGGVSGYGAGALMPLVLVPVVGAEPVVPIVALASMFTNSSRAMAFAPALDRRRAAIVLAAATPTCMLGAYGYSLLTGKGALIVIGSMMVASVPLRRTMLRRGFRCGDAVLAAGSAGWGFLVGGTTGAGVILLSLLMAAGLEGRAVIATDAVVSIVTGVAKLSVFGIAGIMTAQVIAVALLIGFVAFPGAFLAKRIVDRMPLKVHTAILDAVVIFGGGMMLFGAFRQ
jgi:uncharacterized membrane protein YfcA